MIESRLSRTLDQGAIRRLEYLERCSYTDTQYSHPTYAPAVISDINVVISQFSFINVTFFLPN